MANLDLRNYTVGPYGNSAYVLVCKETNQSVIVDCPPPDATEILRQAEGTNVAAIILTHGHMDHVWSLIEVKNALNVPVKLHPADYYLLKPEQKKLVDEELQHGQNVTWGRLAAAVLHTPGHTPGSVCFTINGDLVSGDTLFPGGPGKTQKPEDCQEILRQIKAQLLPMPDDTRVWPGHGEGDTMGAIRARVAVFDSKPHPVDLCGDVDWLTS
ncbi:MAG TPA: MBL fold metallo-hydrolase [Dehalococcoidia bacterium]|nr:MBL fold metallo-hydrolase [Dehalococcoidia bacterium]